MENINLGAVEAPYQEFTYTIQPLGLIKVEYVTDNFVLLDVSAEKSLEVNFGGAANQTNFTAGVQYQLKEAVPNVTLLNNSNSPLTVHFAVGTGNIRDNRLSVNGTISVAESYNVFEVSREVFGAAGIITIQNYGRLLTVQNTGAASIYIGAANGFEVVAGGSIDLPISCNVSIYGTNGQSFVVGSYSNV